MNWVVEVGQSEIRCPTICWRNKGMFTFKLGKAPQSWVSNRVESSKQLCSTDTLYWRCACLTCPNPTVRRHIYMWLHLIILFSKLLLISMFQCCVRSSYMSQRFIAKYNVFRGLFISVKLASLHPLLCN